MKKVKIVTELLRIEPNRSSSRKIGMLKNFEKKVKKRKRAALQLISSEFAKLVGEKAFCRGILNRSF